MSRAMITVPIVDLITIVRSLEHLDGGAKVRGGTLTLGLETQNANRRLRDAITRHDRQSADAPSRAKLIEQVCVNCHGIGIRPTPCAHDCAICGGTGRVATTRATSGPPS